MADIVEALKAWPAMFGGADALSASTVSKLMLEAADEIERLRAVADRASVGAGWQDIGTYHYGTRKPGYYGLTNGARALLYVPAFSVILVGTGYQDHTGDTAFEGEVPNGAIRVKPTLWMRLPTPPVGAYVGAGQTLPENSAVSSKV